jgi:hypothetical protein
MKERANCMGNTMHVTLDQHRPSSFIEGDIKAVLAAMEKNDVDIIYIVSNEGRTVEEKYNNLRLVLSQLSENTDEHTVILSDAYISAQEYPKEVYPFPYGITNEKIESILDQQSKILEDAGFFNINDFIQYEYKRGFIYKNKIGNEVIEFIKGTSKRAEKERS